MLPPRDKWKAGGRVFRRWRGPSKGSLGRSHSSILSAILEAAGDWVRGLILASWGANFGREQKNRRVSKAPISFSEWIRELGMLSGMTTRLGHDQ